MGSETDICNQTLADLLEARDAEILKLKKNVEEKNEELHKAGDLGNGLLLQNASLEEMLEGLQKEHAKVIEEYEQEKYSLGNKLEVASKINRQIEQNLQEDTERWKVRLEAVEQQTTKKHADEINSLRCQFEELSTTLHQEKLISKQRSETIALKETQIQSLQRELKQIQTNLNDTFSSEMAELTCENCDLKIRIQELETDEHNLAQMVHQLKDMLGVSKSNEESLKQAKEDVERETSSYYTSLENSREECRELQAEIGLLKLQPNDPNSRGNSLFAEVEDKRVQAEKKLISMKTQYRCMQSQNEQLKHYILKLKMQMSALLDTRSRNADSEHVRSLQSSLSVARADNTKLIHKLKELQEKLSRQRLEEQNPSSSEATTENPAVVQFFKNELKARNAEVERLTEELRLSEIYLMAESKKASELSRDLYERKKLLDASNSKTFRQQIEIDRLKMKCGEDVKVRAQPHRWTTEKIRKTPSKIENRASRSGEAPGSNDAEQENLREEMKRCHPEVDIHTEDSPSVEAEIICDEKAKRPPLTEITETQQVESEATPDVGKSNLPEMGDVGRPQSPLKPPPDQTQTKSAFAKYNSGSVRPLSRTNVTSAADCKQQ